jgi:hypothetical protein
MASAWQPAERTRAPYRSQLNDDVETDDRHG